MLLTKLLIIKQIQTNKHYYIPLNILLNTVLKHEHQNSDSD